MMSDKNDNRPHKVIDVDPVTLLVVTIAALFIPIFIAGFWN